MSPPSLTAAPGPCRSGLVTVLGWVFIVTGILGLPISFISGAMFITRGYGTQQAELPGILTVVAGPAAVLVFGIGLLRHWAWAWWGSLLLALIVFGFSLKDFVRKPAPPVTRVSETGTLTTVYSSGGGIAALTPLLISGGVLALLLLPSVRGHFRRAQPTQAPAAAPPVTCTYSMNAADSESTAIQQEILFALRSGAEFRTAHKEGGTIIRWQHGRFIREDYGDWNEHAEYTDEAAFLAFLWRFFEWEGRGFQRLELPDAARWENIRQLLHGGSSGIGTHRRVLVNELSRAWKIGAFVIAAAAVALVVWLRGGIHWRTGARPEPAPQKLDTFDGRPPQVTQPAFKLPKPGVPRP